MSRAIAPISTGRRVAAYLRVSTGRQAEADLSLPDQLYQAKTFCDARDWTLAAVFEDAGASGTDEDRPEFQRMIAEATGAARPFEIVLVHSTSRFARDLYVSELYTRRLRRAGVELVSITQDIAGHDGTAVVLRQMLAVFDEHQSRENAKHTLRAMQENARQGYWNGAIAPFGYRTEAAGQRGHRIKKALVVDEVEAAIVRRTYAMYLGLEGASLGVKAIASRLNSEGERFRGKPFSTANVHRLLTSETYAGRHWFNRVDSRNRRAKPREQWVPAEVPAIIGRETFEQAQETLAARAPSRTPPRVVTGPVLLTGLAICGTCKGGMTLRTGKSGRYRYYTCANCAHRGRTICPGRSVPMDALDRAVIEAFADRVLAPARLEALLAGYLARSAAGSADRQSRINRLKAEITEATGAKARLIRLVASGALSDDDPELARELREAEDRRRRAEEALRLLEGQTKAEGPKTLTPAKIARVGAAIRQALLEGEPAFRRAYLRLFVGQVEVEDERVTVRGPTAALIRAATAENPESLGGNGSQFRSEWRPREDSNLRPQD